MRGFEVEVCLRCGAALMDHAHLEVIADGGNVPGATPPPAPRARPRMGTPSAPTARFDAAELAPPPIPKGTRSAPLPRSLPPEAGAPTTPMAHQVQFGSAPTLMPAEADRSDAGGRAAVVPEPLPVRRDDGPSLGNFGAFGGAAGEGPGFGEDLDLGGDPDSTEEMVSGDFSHMVGTPRPARRSAPVGVGQPQPSVSNEDDVLEEWAARRRRGRRLWITVAVVAWLGIIGASAIIVILAWPQITARVSGSPSIVTPHTPGAQGGPVEARAPVVPVGSAEAPAAVDEQPVIPAPVAPAPAPVAPAPAPVAPAPAPVAPAPAPVAPAPAPVAPAPARPTSRSLVSRGWSSVESDPAAAAGLFSDAIARNPDDPDANYGYGYALIRMHNTAAARAPLCRARLAGDVETQREVTGLISRNNITCD